MKSAHGLNRTEVVVICAVALVLGMMTPLLLADRRELAARSSCAANLRGILNCTAIYAASNNDQYPYVGGASAVTYDVTLKSAVGKKTADDTVKDIYKEKLFQNNPYAPWWILVLDQGLSPKLFICKEDPFKPEPAKTIADGEKDKNDNEKYYQNFQSPRNVSYSLAYPWQEDKEKNIVQAPWWRNTCDASLPVASDMAPYLGEKAAAGEAATKPATAPASQPSNALIFEDDKTAGLAKIRSQNHNFAGFNVAFGDVHVDFTRRADVGMSSDNIWTQTVGGNDKPIEAGTLHEKLTATTPPYDIVMVPTRSAKGDLK